MSFDWTRFVPVSARKALSVSQGRTACISGQLLTRYASAIDAPVLELTARRAASLAGFLRACHQADAVAVVAVGADVRTRGPQAGALAVSGILAAAATAHHVGPIVLVARASRPVSRRTDIAFMTHLDDTLARDVEAGFGAIGLAAAAFHDVDVLAHAARLAIEFDLGIEIEVGATDDAALLLAGVDDRALPISAVRGARPLDELGDAARIVGLADLRDLDGLDRGGLRVNLDAVVDNRTDDDNDSDDDDDDDVEARTWNTVTRVLKGLKADGSATRLAAVLMGTQ